MGVFETKEVGGQTERKTGLEQEFFLVDAEGRPSERADEFLRSCHEASGDDSSCYAPEFVKGMVEVSTPPVSTMADLAREYLEKLGAALDVARALGLRLYPLGTYPLPVEPAIREGELDYDIQVKTVGPERFVHAGRCAGAHLHLELPPGTVDANTGLSPAASAAARSEALGMHNLATALDPALVALTRSCPFYEGRASGLAGARFATGEARASAGRASTRACRRSGPCCRTRRTRTRLSGSSSAATRPGSRPWRRRGWSAASSRRPAGTS